MKILIADDNQGARDDLQAFLTGLEHTVVVADGGENAHKLFLDDEKISVVITDWQMPDVDGLELIRRIRGCGRSNYVYVFLLTGEFTEQEHFELGLAAGADDFLVKSLDENWLRTRLWQAQRFIKERQLQADLQTREAELQLQIVRADLVGESKPMQDLGRKIIKLAGSNFAVLIHGETGVGKGVVARKIHELSPRGRRADSFHTQDCGNIVHTLQESTLFGYVKGAFTGADADRDGVFTHADGGTLFLDEVGNASPETQVRLLRVLQHKEFVRVGSTKTEHVDVRIIAATNCDLRKLIEQGKFRADLFYRLNEVPLHVPTLRERASDIPLLAKRILGKKCLEAGIEPKAFAPEALARLMEYPWPGNIRELEGVIVHAVVLSDGPLIRADDIDFQTLPVNAATPTNLSGGFHARLKVMKRNLWQEYYDAANGNIPQAAELAGVPYNTFLGWKSKF